MSSVNILVEELLSENVITDVIANHYSGKSQESLDNIKNVISKIKTQDDKEKVLSDIEKLIDNSNRVASYGSFKEFLGGMLVAGIAGELARLVIRSTNENDRTEFRKELVKIKNKVQAIKVKE